MNPSILSEEIILKFNDQKNSKLDERICRCIIKVQQMCDLQQNEIELFEVVVKDNLLTCVLKNQCRVFKLIKRKANIGEFIYIIKDGYLKGFLNKCFRVSNVCEDDEFTLPHIMVGINCIYDEQYLVLSQID